GAAPVPLARVQDYRVIFQQCRNGLNQTRLAIRRMSVDGESFLLMVDPATLATRLEHEQCWTCAETDDEAQKDTRFIRAVEGASRPAAGGAAPQPAVFDAGLRHGATDGSFITGDLCPSRKPLDRGFLETLERMGQRTPVALAPSGLWLTRHRVDFEWLRGEERSGALDITWINHSYHHPYAPGRRPANNFLLTPGVNMQAEILDTERLLIANGETPSIFFRFPGLISDATLVEAVRRDHLVTLGADGWLVFAPPLRPGAILLVHPNGNEHEGLRLFWKQLNKGALPRPFRSINDAP
ncbi:MAG: polysaccharide deacetylase, partial [Roseiarcus sp.]